MGRDTLPFRVGRVFWDLTGWTRIENRDVRFLLIACLFTAILLFEWLLNLERLSDLNAVITVGVVAVTLLVARGKSPTTRIETRLWVRRAAFLFVGWLALSCFLTVWELNPAPPFVTDGRQPRVTSPTVGGRPAPEPKEPSVPFRGLNGEYVYCDGARMIREGDSTIIRSNSWDYAEKFCMDRFAGPYGAAMKCLNWNDRELVDNQALDLNTHDWKSNVPGFFIRFRVKGTTPVRLIFTYWATERCGGGPANALYKGMKIAVPANGQWTGCYIVPPRSRIAWESKQRVLAKNDGATCVQFQTTEPNAVVEITLLEPL